jgi:hypothetical protein
MRETTPWPAAVGAGRGWRCSTTSNGPSVTIPHVLCWVLHCIANHDALELMGVLKHSPQTRSSSCTLYASNVATNASPEYVVICTHDCDFVSRAARAPWFVAADLRRQTLLQLQQPSISLYSISLSIVLCAISKTARLSCTRTPYNLPRRSEAKINLCVLMEQSPPPPTEHAKLFSCNTQCQLQRCRPASSRVP